MKDYKTKIEVELKKLLNDMHEEFNTNDHASVMQRVMYGLEITQIEQEIKNLEFERIEKRITELKQTNQILHEKILETTEVSDTLRQASIVFNNAEDGIIVMDAMLNIINSNHAFNEITGYTSDELIKKNHKDLFTSRTDNDQYNNMQNSLHEKGHWKGEVWYQCKNGSQIPVWKNINEVKDDNDIVTHYVAIATDITSLKETEMRLDHLAHHDMLTGLPNRLHYTANIEQSLKRAQRRGSRLALILLDLDNFKIINDTFGHAHGDTFLKVVAERLLDCVRQEDTVARLGGDEFAIVLEDITDFDDAGAISEKILQAITEPIEIERKAIVPSTSIGVSIYPDNANDAENLLKAADAAMYRAKQNGGNKFQYFTAELTTYSIEKMALENQLKLALSENQFEVYYQPKVTLSNAMVVGMEALLRWNHPEKGLIKPDKFIKVAEDSGIIDDIDEWVLNTACAQIKSWQDTGLAPIRISINLAGRTLTHDHKLVDKVRGALEKYQLEASSLEVEIPEKILKTTRQSIKTLTELKELGVNISVDDFGTGLTSISSLKQLPIDTIKIDRSFVCDVTTNSNDAEMASALIAMAHNLNMKVTAEGVSTAEQIHFLRDQGCDEMQGYFFSKPMNSEHARSYIEKGILH
jgi:diguanylate cyclase (GGDEF)-like protein/PAS domain S-box-containing protein